MKKIVMISALCALLLLSACGGMASIDRTDEEQTRIQLNGDTARITGGGARVSGNVITIASGGGYAVSGTLDGGQLVVDTGDTAMDVWLILDNASITNPSGPAIHIRQAKNVWLTTLTGTSNLLVSGTEADLAAFDDARNGAALFSEDDLILAGEGELEIRGYLNNGVTCKDDLEIESGVVRVLAAGNGLRGSESVTVTGGELSVTAGNDGIKSTSSAKEGKGYVTLSGGTVSVEALGDGISAETALTLSGADITVIAEGDGFRQGSKALKANAAIEISGGTLDLSSVEDAVSCGGDVLIRGGSLLIRTQGDGIQAGEKGSGIGDITVSGGSLGICAARRAMNARGNWSITGGTVLACIGSAKQALPTDSAAVLFANLSGAAGDRITLDGEDLGLEAAYPFVAVLYAGETVASGETHAFSTGTRTVNAVAK